MKFGKKALIVALLLLGLILVNYLASTIPYRVDATAGQIYTLSPGTKSLLAKVTEPVAFEFYFSKSAPGLRVDQKNYAERVREMLRQYVRAARGKITVTFVDPEPDTPAEEKATAAGIEAQRASAGAEPFYLGLVAIQADQQKAIPALTPEREQFLEYDISDLVYNVQQLDKKKLGLITSLPLQGQQGNPMMGQQGTEGQYVVSEWSDTFNLQTVDPTATELPPGLDALAIVHPENLTPKLLFAIDQFLLAGKPVFLAVDPASQYFKHQGGEMAMFQQGGQPNVSSDLPGLLNAWGIRYDPLKVVGDNQAATQVQTQAGTLSRYPIWLSLGHDNFSAVSPATAELSSMMFIEAGSVSLRPGAAVTFTPLVQTTDQAGELDTSALQFAQPDEIARKLIPSGKRTIAALVTGKFASAFPGGMPADEPAADAKKTGLKPAVAPHLTASTGSSTLIIVADTDWLLDDYSVRKVSVLGTNAVEPLNDNLSFAANALDYLAGSQDLISLRGKGTSLRPFKVVQAMATKANDKYEEKLGALESQLNDVQTKLTELQGKKTEGNRLVASPEMAKAIDDFQKQEAKLRGERREIRLALREGIDSLENRLLAINLLASPLLVCLFGVWFYRSRRR